MELYKKYRPKTLDKFVGNYATVEALRNMLSLNTLPRAILFYGPSGCGKTTLARILAKELGCQGSDFQELNIADFRGVDTVRELREEILYAPLSKCKVYILDEFHMMTKEGQNAILKLLEDTPKHAYFFLCTTEPEKLITTVRNRCEHMEVSRLSVSEMSSLLVRVIKREGIEIKEEIKLDIIDRAEGSARFALVLLDKIAHLNEKHHSGVIDIRLKDEKQAIDLCRALMDHNRNWGNISSILREMRTSNLDIERVRYAILGYATSILLKASNDKAAKILAVFEQNLYDGKFFGLVLRCFEVVNGD